MRERILCSAVLFKGKIITGYRHSDCIETLEFFNVPQSEMPTNRKDFGFLTSNKRFVSRKEAYEIAYREGQIIYGVSAFDPDDRQLISENLYMSPDEF